MNLTTLHISILEVFQHLQIRHPELQSNMLNISYELNQSEKLPPLIKPLIKRYCKGRGLEIGAGKYPYCDPENTIFLDKYTNNKDGTPNPDIVSDASNIPCNDASFDYVFSSHVLEHMQNTIATLKEWVRVLNNDGILFLMLPHGDRTFDKNRKKTTLEHHITDYKNLTNAPDYSHNQEIRDGWSLNNDAKESAIDYEQQWGADMWDFDFRINNGVIHFHVWSQDEMTKLIQYLGLKILWVCEMVDERPDTFVLIAKKS